MCFHQSSFQPAQFLLLVGVLVASVLLLVQCLRWHCPCWMVQAFWKLDRQEEPVSESPPLPENESPRPCPPATLSEMAAFYQELHMPTKGLTVIRQLMHKLLVFSAREVDHRGGCLILKDTGISLLIPPGNSAPARFSPCSCSDRALYIGECIIQRPLPDFENYLYFSYDFIDSKDKYIVYFL